MPVDMTVEDLLRQPEPIPYVPYTGLFIRFPDGESTMLVHRVDDERWRSFNGSTLLLNGFVFGPALQWSAAEFVAGLPGFRSLHRFVQPLIHPDGGIQREIGLRYDATVTVVKALPHSCGAQPGQPCDQPWWRSPCRAADRQPVDVTTQPAPVATR